jgi:hypothetical protein
MQLALDGPSVLVALSPSHATRLPEAAVVLPAVVVACHNNNSDAFDMLKVSLICWTLWEPYLQN